MNSLFLRCLILATVLFSGCGDGKGGADNANTSLVVPQSTSQAIALMVKEALFAQTHALLPGGGSADLTTTGGGSWDIANHAPLDLIGHREALAIIAFQQTDPINPKLEMWQQGLLVGTVVLNSPSALPLTEQGSAVDSRGAMFRSNSYSGVIPAQFMQTGLTLKAVADNYQGTFIAPLNIGADTPLVVKLLPLYLYGANLNIYQTLNNTTHDPSTMSVAEANEIDAKLPASSTTVVKHEIQIQWPYFVFPPRTKTPFATLPTPNPAYRATDASMEKSNWDPVNGAINLMGGIQNATGDAQLNVSSYMPIITLNTTTNPYTFGGLAGGLGGGHKGVGGSTFGGIFWHEMGHSFGLPHTDGLANGTAPERNSLGYAWGYDAHRKEFLAPFLLPGMQDYVGCATNAQRITDSQGRCQKVEPDWTGGTYGQDRGTFNWSMHSEYYQARLREDIAKMKFPDANSGTGFSQWDSVNKRRKDVTVNMQSATPTPAYLIAMTMSKAPCDAVNNPNAVCNVVGVDTNISQVYPVVAYTGRVATTLDPTVPAELATLTNHIGSSTLGYQCWWYGCDYTARITYKDGTVRHVLLSGSFRHTIWTDQAAFNLHDGATNPAALNPLDPASFKQWVFSVPAGTSVSPKLIAKVELLDTPVIDVPNAVSPVNPTVLFSRLVP